MTEENKNVQESKSTGGDITNIDHSEWFDEHVQPIVNQLIEKCSERGVPVIAVAVTKRSEDDENMKALHQGGMFLTSDEKHGGDLPNEFAAVRAILHLGICQAAPIVELLHSHSHARLDERKERLARLVCSGGIPDDKLQEIAKALLFDSTRSMMGSHTPDGDGVH